MSSAQPIEIVGGGIAGLALGLGLRRAGVPVTLFEAGRYPRHRVCGEFIAGLRPQIAAQLGLKNLLADATPKHDIAWYVGKNPVWHQRLPEPALAISRHALDARIAEEFVEAGGHLFEQQQIDLRDTPPGRVFAAGRRRTPSPWLGLKLHACKLPLAAELELHLSKHAYVGLSQVEDGRTNVCGLFHRRPGVAGGRTEALNAYLRASGLEKLADRLAAAEICPDSHCAVAGIGFGRSEYDDNRITLGDAFAMIPPFTGNGMAMAMESAATALDPLVAWARGQSPWALTVRAVNQRLRQRFRLRLIFASLLHPLLLSPHVQSWIVLAARGGWLPLRALYRTLH